MSIKRIAVVGYGNIGQFALEAIEASPDFELAGVVRRKTTHDQPPRLAGVAQVTNVADLGQVDVALLCTPTRAVAEHANKYLNLGINTVDSFDIHASILDLRQKLMPVALANSAVSIIATGWDPGSDSVVRALLEACAPRGLTHTNFGPGLSMGHSVGARAVDGVADALSFTIPVGTGLHRRMVYVELAPGAKLDEVAQRIKADSYFSNDETQVMAVASVEALIDKGHGVNLVRHGASGNTDNQTFEFNMRVNNPALTSQIMLACARATFKQQPGVYTMPEIPVIDLLPGNKEELIARLV